MCSALTDQHRSRRGSATLPMALGRRCVAAVGQPGRSLLGARRPLLLAGAFITVGGLSLVRPASRHEHTAPPAWPTCSSVSESASPMSVYQHRGERPAPGPCRRRRSDHLHRTPGRICHWHRPRRWALSPAHRVQQAWPTHPVRVAPGRGLRPVFLRRRASRPSVDYHRWGGMTHRPLSRTNGSGPFSAALKRYRKVSPPRRQPVVGLRTSVNNQSGTCRRPGWRGEAAGRLRAGGRSDRPAQPRPPRSARHRSSAGRYSGGLAVPGRRRCGRRHRRLQPRRAVRPISPRSALAATRRRGRNHRGVSAAG